MPIDLDTMSENDLISLEEEIKNRKEKLKKLEKTIPQKIIQEYKSLTDRKEISFDITIKITCYWEMPFLQTNYDWGIYIDDESDYTIGLEQLEVISPNIASEFLKKKEDNASACEKFLESLDKYGYQENVIDIIHRLAFQDEKNK
jgi:hypothetical protein